MNNRLMQGHICGLLPQAVIALSFTVIQSLAQSSYEPYTFSTLAGYARYTGSDAPFSDPWGVAVDAGGNVYVADQGNDTIRKVTPAGLVTTLAGLAGSKGSADGAGSTARFKEPAGVAVDSAGNVYVADSGNSTIRRVTLAGVVTTLAGLAGNIGWVDGTADAARFFVPTGVAVDTGGNVYVGDSGNETIRKLTLAGVVTTLAGLAPTVGNADGTGRGARFFSPQGVAVDGAGNVYVADTGNFTIRKVTPAGLVTTLAGLAGNLGGADGAGKEARFAYPTGVAVDAGGNVYVADQGNDTIRKVTPAGLVTTLAGLATLARLPGNLGGAADGTGKEARFSSPAGVAVDAGGNLYVTDEGNDTIRKGYAANAHTVIIMPRARFSASGNQFGFSLTGPPGQAVVVEASTDLVKWLPVWTNAFAGAISFGDPQTSVYSHRFYRAHSP